MLNFKAYSGRELQNFNSFLNQLEAEGITDIRFAKSRLQSHLDKTLVVARAQKVKYSRGLPTRSNPMLCPSCEKMTLQRVASLEGVSRVGCKCGYSKVV